MTLQHTFSGSPLICIRKEIHTEFVKINTEIKMVGGINREQSKGEITEISMFLKMYLFLNLYLFLAVLVLSGSLSGIKMFCSVPKFICCNLNLSVQPCTLSDMCCFILLSRNNNKRTFSRYPNWTNAKQTNYCSKWISSTWLSLFTFTQQDGWLALWQHRMYSFYVRAF